MHSFVTSQILRIAKTWICDAVFPHRCGVCDSIGLPICEACFRAIPRRSKQVCGFCGARETPLGATCFECSPAPEDGIFASTDYQSPKISRLIHLFKYRFIEDLSAPLGQLLSDSVIASDLPIPDIIVPIPLHPRRERWRGWNQANLLAQALANALPREIAPTLAPNLLIRTKFTAPQMSLQKRNDREQNVKDAFSINNLDGNLPDIHGKRFWLVDDVSASGSTIRECARILKSRGAQEVWGVVVAR